MMVEYTGPDEVSGTTAPGYGIPAVKQMGGREPVENDEPLITFLYLLLRDRVAPGVVEQVMCEVEYGAKKQQLLTNEYLAGYAGNINERLVRAAEARVKALRGES